MEQLEGGPLFPFASKMTHLKPAKQCAGDNRDRRRHIRDRADIHPSIVREPRPKEKPQTPSGNLRPPVSYVAERLFVNDHAVDRAGLTHGVIINVHACSRPDHRGFDCPPRLVHVMDSLAQNVTDRIGHTLATDNDGLARFEGRHRAIGEGCRGGGFSRDGIRRRRLRGGRACLGEGQRRDRGASETEDCSLHYYSLPLLWLNHAGKLSWPQRADGSAESPLWKSWTGQAALVFKFRAKNRPFAANIFHELSARSHRLTCARDARRSCRHT